MGDPTPLITALDDAGYRLTGPRRALAETDRRPGRPLHGAGAGRGGARRALGVGRATVFRALEVLEELGVVERLDLPCGEHAYVWCERAHHHHVVCSRCGRTDRGRRRGPATLSSRVERLTGYRVDAHRLELFGLCPPCQANDRAPDRDPRRLTGDTPTRSPSAASRPA